MFGQNEDQLATWQSLADLSPQELAAIEVITVSRRPQRLSQTAAAVFVITQEDIRRSGVTSVPDALRLALGVQVAQISASQWAIGVRGFASALSRSLLVLIDGRSVYTPLFAGTYWDVQDVLLEEIERIEIIRGPGGTLWGANAVNGVINIITKRARETQGGFLSVGGGNVERGLAAFQYGGSLGQDAYYRFYSKYFDRGPLFHRDGNYYDRWRMGRAGFRSDWQAGNNELTFQGDFYNGRAGERAVLNQYTPPFLVTQRNTVPLSGGNIMGSWQRPLGGGSDLDVRVYYDRTNRATAAFRENRNTFDIDMQHTLTQERNSFAWGSGYRVSSGTATGIPTVVFTPTHRTDHLSSAFVHDEFAFVPGKVEVALGIKIEHNGYSGFEWQPSGSLVINPSGRQTLWGSISRAVRTPSRVDEDIQLTRFLRPLNAFVPIFARQTGDQEFRPEEIIAYQAGYRIQPASSLSFDLTAFLNDHRDLLSLRPGAPVQENEPAPIHVVVPVFHSNGISGKSHGIEFASDWQVAARWRVLAAYSYLRLHLKNNPDNLDLDTVTLTEGSSPHHQLTVQSSVGLSRTLELGSVFRYVGSLSAQNVDAYKTADVRLSWAPVPKMEFAVVGQNLLQPHHLEFGGGPAATEVKRGYYGRITWFWQ
jgi:iron complex outermembrane receptor protein